MSARCKSPYDLSSLSRSPILAGRCRMVGFWASLLRQDSGEPRAIIRVAQSDPELDLDQAVRDALVVVVKAARHRRQPGGLEHHERWLLDPEKLGGVSNDRRGRRRIVVADIVDRTRP